MLARLHKLQEEREEGFTLIELLVVIIIIGILAAIAIPVFLNQRQKGYDAQAKSDLRNMATAEESYLTDNDTYRADTTAADETALEAEGFSHSNAKDYSGTNFTPGTTFFVHILKDAATVATVGTDPLNVGYCIEGKSATTGHTFAYNSLLGGLQSGTSATCP